MSEQRGEYRLTRRATALVEVPTGAGHCWLACRVLDFSAGGMQILVDRTLVIGQILKVRFHEGYLALPMEVVAEVRWQKAAGNSWNTGFSLYMADQTDIQRWKEFVASQLA